ncbi:MAG: multidrug transporter [Gammaproteobacteria bacterium]|nr:multidrug transporter [Gammaproteobacteria bacterium]
MKLQAFRKSTVARPLVLVAALLLCQPAFAATDEDSDPNKVSAMDMTGDLLIGRPLLLTATVLGTAIWLVALPFSALGGNVKDSAEALIGWPARNTFERCLGCPTAGYKKD